jgi:arabinofuranan 3-O-arabinosyltransferase
MRRPSPHEALLVPGALVMIAYSLRTASSWPGAGGDLRPVLVAAEALRYGNPLYPLDEPLSAAVFAYPPSSALLSLPLTLLDAGTARAVMGAVNTLATIATVAVSVKLLRLPHSSTITLATVAALTFTVPYFALVHGGNLGGIVALLTVSLLLAARDAQWWQAGFLFGIALALKPMTAPLLLLFVVSRRSRSLAVAIAAFAALNGVALLLMEDPGETLGLLSYLAGGTTLTGDNAIFSGSLRAFFDTHDLQPGLLLVAQVVTALVGIIGSFIAWRRDAPLELRLVEASGILLIAAFLAGPLLEPSYLPVLLPTALSLLHPDSAGRNALVGLGLVLAWPLLDITGLGIGPPPELAQGRLTFGCALWLAGMVVGAAGADAGGSPRYGVGEGEGRELPPPMVPEVGMMPPSSDSVGSGSADSLAAADAEAAAADAEAAAAAERDASAEAAAAADAEAAAAAERDA